MAISRAVYWLSGLVVCTCLAIATWMAFFTDIEVLLRYANDRSHPAVQWISRKSIYAVRLTPDEVRELNQDAGAYAAVNLRDKVEAENMLKFFLSRGVDINGLSGLSRSTALHLAVSANDPSAVSLLLQHGASIDLKNDQGLTPLDLVRSLQAQNPQDDYSAIVNLLSS